MLAFFFLLQRKTWKRQTTSGRTHTFASSVSSVGRRAVFRVFHLSRCCLRCRWLLRVAAVVFGRVGQRITEEERQALVAKYKVILSTDSLNGFLERLPRDMLFVMRTSDLVRSLNKVRCDAKDRLHDGGVPCVLLLWGCGAGKDVVAVARWPRVPAFFVSWVLFLVVVSCS